MPNEEIGKLNVVVNMDSTGFQNGISQLNRQMKLVQSEFQAATAKLGDFGNSTDALKLKADSLTKQIDIQKQKVAALEAAYQKSVETKGADAKATQELAIKLNNAKAELAKMENELKKLDEEIKKQSNSWLVLGKHMDEISEKTKKIGESFSKVGKNLSKYVTLPITGAVGGLLKLGSEFDKANDKIRIGTGATGKSLEALKNDFKAVYSSIPATMDEASTAISDLNTRLGLTGEPLQELSKQVIRLSHMMNTDLTTTIENVSHAFGAFNVQAKDYGRALDFVFKVSQSTGISIDNLLSTIQSSAPALKSMGLDFESAAALIGQLSKAGVNVEQVLTGLNKGIANMAKAGIKDANEAIAKLFEQIRKAPNDMVATQIAVETFGTKTGVAIAKAAREGKLNFQDFLNTLEKSPETINKAAEETADFPEKLQKLKNQLTVALEPLANSVFDAVNKMMPIIEQFADKLKNIIDRFANLSPVAQKNILIFAGIAAALGPVLLIFSKFMEVGSGVIKTIGSIAKFMGNLGGLAGIAAKLAPAFNVLKTAISGVGTAMKFALANPWILVVAAIIAGVVLIITHWNRVKMAAQEVGDYIKKIWNSIIDWLKNLSSNFYNIATNMINSMHSGISSTIGNVKNAIVNGVKNAISYLKSLPSEMFNWGRDMLSGFVNGIKSMINKIEDVVKNIASTIRKYLHFSTPDEGPLSDADTYMPDMIELFATGILKNKDKLISALHKITAEMSKALQITTKQITTKQNITLTQNAPAGLMHFTINVYGNNSAEQTANEIIRILKLRGVLV